MYYKNYIYYIHSFINYLYENSSFKCSKKETIEKYQYAMHLYENKNIPIDKACKQAGIAKTTFYRIENEINRSK